VGVGVSGGLKKTIGSRVMFCEFAPMKEVASISKITKKGFTGMNYATNMPSM